MIRTNLNNKKVISLFTLLVLITAGSIWKPITSSRAKRDISEFTVKAKSGNLPGLITASGELQAILRVNVSPKKQGILQEIFVDEGDEVKKGELIAKMDYGDLLYKVKELEAVFKTQRANFRRRELLFNEGAISAEQYEEYKNKFLTSEARLQQKEVERNELEIRAPFPGLITTRYSVPGAFVTPTTMASTSPNGGSTSSSIVELSQGLEAIAKVPESDIGRIQEGQVATIRVDAFPDKRFQAKVKEISPRAIKSNNVTSFEVTLLIIEEHERLRIGMTADIEFQTGATNIGILIPTVAIVTKKGEPGVLIVGKNSQPEFREVELGKSSGSKTEIISGINQGDPVFINLPPWAKQRQD